MLQHFLCIVNYTNHSYTFDQYQVFVCTHVSSQV